MNALRERLKQQFGVRTVLLLILALGFVLRLPGLDRDLWFDEASSLFNARGTDALTTKVIPNGPEFTSEIFARDGGWRESLLAISHAEYTPPLYFVLLRLWIKVFGESNQILRLLSVIIGLATILAMFSLGRKVFGEKVGLAAAAVLAILPLPIQYSQEIRGYGLSVLFVTVATWAYWCGYLAIGHQEERKYWIFYLLLATASLYTHYLTAGVFIGHGVFALAQPRSLRLALVKRLALVVLALVILFIPWFLSPYVKNQLHLVEHTSLISGFWALESLRRIAALMCYFFAGYLPGVTFKSVLGLMLLILWATGAWIVLSIARMREKQPAVLFSFLLLFMPLLFVIGAAATLDKAGLITQPRFIIASLTGLGLLFGAIVVSSRQRVLSFLIVALAVAMSLHFQVKWHSLIDSASAPWWSYGNVSPAVAEVNRRAKPGELILFDDYGLVPSWNVYQKARLPQLLMGQIDFYFHQPLDLESRWQEVKSKYDGIYLIRGVELSPTDVLKRLETDYRLMSRERIHWLEIRHYRQPSSLAPVEDESR